jgi:heme/copper-type cytochrome/quinol oxidase subunit 2
MNGAALVLMGVVWSVVTLLMVYFMYKVLRPGKKRKK